MTLSSRSAKRDGRFLAAMAGGASVRQAAQAAGYSAAAAYRYREFDPAFAERWKEAEAERLDRLEEEADRRGVEGVLKPVFWKGEECGQIREFSDSLLMFRLKALAPARYRERSDLKVDAGPTLAELILGSMELERAPGVDDLTGRLDDLRDGSDEPSR